MMNERDIGHLWGQKRNAQRVLMGKYERKRPRVKPSHTCGRNIKVYLKEPPRRGLDLCKSK